MIATLANKLQGIPGVLSVTFTGSFVERPGIGNVRDIDVVVVIEKLNQKLFSQIKTKIRKVKCKDFGLPGKRFIINDTFGPRKILKKGSVVLHLMVYDRVGHLRHAIASPFTCFDWERSACFFGTSLRDLAPVLGLQPRHFLKSRRGIFNYLGDLESGCITYRKYTFSKKPYREIKKKQLLDKLHRTEFCFHVVKNLVANFAKLFYQKNIKFNERELIKFWRQHLGSLAVYAPWFQKLAFAKKHLRPLTHENPVPMTRAFCMGFYTFFIRTLESQASKYYFMRHARTALNDGRFLGQQFDPPVASLGRPLSLKISRVFSSPSRRSLQTAIHHGRPHRPVWDRRLSEIDYGDAEGLTMAKFSAQYPEILRDWEKGGDPAFPSGESTSDVLARLKSFLKDLSAQPTLIVTHNVVIRCLLGHYLHLPKKLWHKIPIVHEDPIELYSLKNRIIVNLRPNQTKRITKALVKGDGF